MSYCVGGEGEEAVESGSLKVRLLLWYQNERTCTTLERTMTPKQSNCTKPRDGLLTRFPKTILLVLINNNGVTWCNNQKYIVHEHWTLCTTLYHTANCNSVCLLI